MSNLITDQDAPELKPVVAHIHVQEIAALYAAHTGPYMFEQRVLEELRNAGAPVEGIIKLTLKSGQWHKLMHSPRGPEYMSYIWLPADVVKRLVAYRKMMGERVDYERLAVA